MMQLAVYRGPASSAPFIYKLAHALICIRTVSRYSHCELVINGVCWSSSVQDGGVRSKIITLKSGRWDVFPLDSRFDENYALQYMKEREGWKYGWRGIVRFVLPFVKQKDDEAFCSQIVAGALQLPNPEDYHIQKLISDTF